MPKTKTKKIISKKQPTSRAKKVDGAAEGINLEALLDEVGTSGFINNISADQKAELREGLDTRLEFDRPYSRTQIENLGAPGRFTIFREWTWVERLEVLERCHQAWERNPIANSGVAYTTQFAIGDGGQLSFYAKEVQQVLEEFIKEPENNFKSYEKEFCDGLQVDGEIFVRFFVSPQGRVTIVPLRPWHIQWLDTDPEFYKRVTSYHYVFMISRDHPGQSDFGQEDIPENEVLHVSINKFAYEMRGRPELFRVLPWLKAYKDWLEDRARINKRKGAILYDVSLKNATPGQVSAKRQQYQQPPNPGSLLIHNDNEIWKIMSAQLEAGDAQVDGRQMKLMIAAGLREPEFFFADGANANLATSKSQAMPVIRKFSNFQDTLEKQCWIPIFKRVIKSAIDAGRIPETVQEVDANGDPVMLEPSVPGLMLQAFRQLKSGKITEAFSTLRAAADNGMTPKLIKAEDAFDYSYPDLEAQSPQMLAAAMQIATQNEWVSNETATREMGYDPSVEQKKIQREKDIKQSQQYSQFGGGYGQGPSPFGGNEEPGNLQPENTPAEQAQVVGQDTGVGSAPVMPGTGSIPEPIMTNTASPSYTGNDFPGGQ